MQTMSVASKPQKKLTLIHKSITINELITYLKPKLQYFVHHNFVVNWQDMQFKLCLKYVQPGSVILVIDFAKNYSFVIQNEVQSMHWHSYHISILIHITYRPNLNFDLNDAIFFLIIEYHFYISDDHKHDSYFVQHCS
jgi:hypothetical protein